MVHTFWGLIGSFQYLLGGGADAEEVEVGNKGLLHKRGLFGLVVFGIIRLVEDPFDIGLACNFREPSRGILYLNECNSSSPQLLPDCLALPRRGSLLLS